MESNLDAGLSSGVEPRSFRRPHNAFWPTPQFSASEQRGGAFPSLSSNCVHRRPTLSDIEPSTSPVPLFLCSPPATPSVAVSGIGRPSRAVFTGAKVHYLTLSLTMPGPSVPHNCLPHLISRVDRLCTYVFIRSLDVDRIRADEFSGNLIS